MTADFEPVAVRPEMVGVVDHPGGKPKQLPLQLLQSRQILAPSLRRGAENWFDHWAAPF